MVVTRHGQYRDPDGARNPGARLAYSRKSERGFTLVELMIGVVLVGVLLGIGAPSFRALIAEQRLRAVSTDLRLALNMARSEAVKRNRSVVLSPSAGGWGDGWGIANPDDPNNPAILNQVQSDGITITGPAGVAFNSFGRTLAAADFEVGVDTYSEAAMCLQMQLDGRAVAHKGACP